MEDSAAAVEPLVGGLSLLCSKGILLGTSPNDHLFFSEFIVLFSSLILRLHTSCEDLVQFNKKRSPGVVLLSVLESLAEVVDS